LKILMIATLQRAHAWCSADIEELAIKDANRTLELAPKVPASVLDEDSRSFAVASAYWVRMVGHGNIGMKARKKGEVKGDELKKYTALALTDANRVVETTEALVKARATKKRPPDADPDSLPETLLGLALRDRGVLHAVEG